MNKVFDDISQEQWQNALRKTILIEGEPNDELYERAVRLFAAPRSLADECFEHGVLPPKIHIYAGNELPKGVKEQDEDGQTLHVAIGDQDDDTIIKRMMSAYEYSPHYLGDVQATNSDGRSFDVSDREKMEVDRHQDGDRKRPGTGNYANNRSRSEYDPTELADHTSNRSANTYGQLCDWREAYYEHLELKEKYPEQPTLWEFYQRKMFSDEVMDKFRGKADVERHDGRIKEVFPFWKDWLRGLRVMNGRSTVEMTGIFYNNNGNSGWQNLENQPGHDFSLNKTKRVLSANVFRLPEIEKDGHTFADPEYAAKFCDMMGKGEIIYAEPIRKHFLERVKAAAEDYIVGKITVDDMPAISDLLIALGATATEAKGPLAHRLDNIKDKLIIDGVDYTQYFEVMPHYDADGNKMPSKALSREEAFKVASHDAKNAGEFLKIYRTSIGETMTEVGERMGLTRGRIHQYEYPKFKLPTIVAKLLDQSNPYHLPEDEHGNIRTDVIDTFKNLNHLRDERVIDQETPVLDKEKAYQLASDNASSVGEFLKIYRQAIGQTINDVTTQFGAARVTFIDHLEKRPKQKKRTLDRILEPSNPYQLPTGENGYIRDDVKEYVRMLNNSALSLALQEDVYKAPEQSVPKLNEDAPKTENSSDYLNIINPISDYNGTLPPRREQDLIFREIANDNLYVDDFGAYSTSYAYELLEAREAKNITRDDLADQIAKHASKAVTVDISQLRHWEQGRGELPAIDEYKGLANTLVGQNGAIEDKEKAAVALFDAYQESIAGKRFRFADTITTLVEQMIGNGHVLNREELVQALNNGSAKANLGEAEALLLKRDRGKFIAAIEAGAVVPSAGFIYLANHVLEAIKAVDTLPDTPPVASPPPEKPLLPPIDPHSVGDEGDFNDEPLPTLYLDRMKAKQLASEAAQGNNPVPPPGLTAAIASRLDVLLHHSHNEPTAQYGQDGEPLRDSQQETLEKWSKRLKQDHHSGHAVLPGGCGKTLIGIVAADAAQQAGTRALFVVPSIAAGDNAYKKFKAANPELSVGRIYNGHSNYEGDVTIVTYQSLINEFYRSLLAKDRNEPYAFNLKHYGLIVADEAHSYLTDISQSILDNANAVKLALTATDRYYEGKEVANKFPGLINRVTLDQAVERNEILKPKNRFIKTDVKMNLEGLEHLQNGGDEELSEEFQRRVNTKPWNQVFVEVWRDETDKETAHRLFGDRTFIHTAGIQHAADMAKQFNDELMPLLENDEYREILKSKDINPDKVEQIAAAISHDTPPDKREEIMEKYRQRKILVLTSAKMLTESIDDPETGVIMNAAPTFSAVKAGQRGYRGSRKAAGKEHWFVYEALPEGWEDAKIAPIMFAETVAEDSPDGALRKAVVGKGSSGDKDAEKPDDNGKIKIEWEVDDIERVLARLRDIRKKQQTRHESVMQPPEGVWSSAQLAEAINSGRAVTSYFRRKFAETGQDHITYIGVELPSDAIVEYGSRTKRLLGIKSEWAQKLVAARQQQSDMVSLSTVYDNLRIAPVAKNKEMIENLLQDWSDSADTPLEIHQKILTYYNDSQQVMRVSSSLVPIIAKELGIATLLPEEKQHWLHSTDIIHALSTSEEKLSTTEVEQELDRLSKGTGIVYSFSGGESGEAPGEYVIGDLLEKHRTPKSGLNGRFYIDPRLLPHFKTTYRIQDILPDEKSHWITGQSIAKRLNTAHTEEFTLQLNSTLERMYHDEHKLYIISNADSKMEKLKPSEVIGCYRNKSGSVEGWYIDPRMIDHLCQEMRMAENIPTDRKHWACGQKLCEKRLHLRGTPENISAMNRVLEARLSTNQVYDINGEQLIAADLIKRYRSAGHTNLYLDPKAEGVVLTKDMVLEEVARTESSSVANDLKTKPIEPRKSPAHQSDEERAENKRTSNER